MADHDTDVYATIEDLLAETQLKLQALLAALVRP